MEKNLFMPVRFKPYLENALISLNIQNVRIEEIGKAIRLTAILTDSEIFSIGFLTGQLIMMD